MVLVERGSPRVERHLTKFMAFDWNGEYASISNITSQSVKFSSFNFYPISVSNDEFSKIEPSISIWPNVKCAHYFRASLTALFVYWPFFFSTRIRILFGGCEYEGNFGLLHCPMELDITDIPAFEASFCIKGLTDSFFMLFFSARIQAARYWSEKDSLWWYPHWVDWINRIDSRLKSSIFIH